MQEEDKRNSKKVQAWVPMDLWDKVESLGYKTATDAVTRGLEKLVTDTNSNPEESNWIHEARARLEELQAHNDTLKNELTQSRQDKEDIKKTFDNYMVQVQTLINQKAIEAPGAKKPWWKIW
jgi:hypothetical protein